MKVTSDHFIIKCWLHFPFILGLFILYVQLSCQHAYLCTMYTPGAYQGYESVLDSLEKELYIDSCEPLCGLWGLNLDPL